MTTDSPHISDTLLGRAVGYAALAVTVAVIGGTVVGWTIIGVTTILAG